MGETTNLNWLAGFLPWPWFRVQVLYFQLPSGKLLHLHHKAKLITRDSFIIRSPEKKYIPKAGSPVKGVLTLRQNV